MKVGWINSSSRDLAGRAASFWGAVVTEHIADSGNSVWKTVLNGAPAVLRLSDPSYRTMSDSRSEIAYLTYLHNAGVPIAAPIRSNSGEFVHAVSFGNETMLASVFAWAPGEHVRPGSPLWTDALFDEWGRSLGKIHRASQSYMPDAHRRRWNWKDEILFAHAERLIPADDTLSHREHETLLKQLNEMPVTSETFGMTHGDFAPQNFHVHSEKGITTFDFGNCCYHWFMSDLAISLSTLRNHPDRNLYRERILAGYAEHMPIDPILLENISLFFRLRALYVYLSRLMKFGRNPTPHERDILSTLRRNVHEPFAW